MMEPTLDQCPLCEREPNSVFWVEDYQQFLVECPLCTTYMIGAGLAQRFQCLLAPDERRMVERLSRYLQHAGDDDDREVTEDSWLRLAADG